jgi:cytochrome b6
MIRPFNLMFALRRTATILSIGILTMTLMAGLSGILIAFNYQPAAGASYRSLQEIATNTNFGWLIEGMHHYAGNLVIALGLIQMVVMFLSRQFKRNWLIAWIAVIGFILSAIGLDWTAMVLDWTQTGFWRLSVELGTIEAIPFVGSLLREIITGGGGISTATLLRLYTIHSYILSLGAVSLAIAHLAGTVLQDRQEQQDRFEQRKLQVEDTLNRLVQENPALNTTVTEEAETSNKN